MTAIVAEDESPAANGKATDTGANGVKAVEKEDAKAKDGAKKEKKEKKDKKRKSVGGDEATAEVRRLPVLMS